MHNNATNSINIVGLVRAEQRYIFLFDDESAALTVFTWYDAAS